VIACVFFFLSELGQSLSDFSKAVKLLGACEGDALGKAFSELGTKSEALSVKLQKEVGLKSIVPSATRFSILFYGPHVFLVFWS
jgi:hypothetical protein